MPGMRMESRVERMSCTSIGSALGSQKEGKPKHWKSDSDSRSCDHCRNLFTFSRRRHHCRMCGGVFCDGCTPHRLPMPCHPKPQRVCNLCKRSSAPDTTLLDDLQEEEFRVRRKLRADYLLLHVHGLLDIFAQGHGEVARQVWRSRRSDRVSLGVQLSPSDGASPPAVAHVGPGSLGERCGVRDGERVLAIGERPVCSQADLLRCEDSLKEGSSTQILLQTVEGEHRTVELLAGPADGRGGCGCNAGGAAAVAEAAAAAAAGPPEPRVEPSDFGG
eukprot:TRINITY_DN8127_c0_g1_i1.p1 TRINITY_DN8127_c0_g1~~TRINITY_DN8127_c0_g1_i1.p1  ORF type:complete len:275 (+),score=57.45 TRINITY_DN8127_c0_g1_i1:87-911(+)